MPEQPAAILGIFAKWPREGMVKTRLAQATAPGWAVTVASAFLRDSLDRWRALPAERWLLVDPPGSVGAFAELAGWDYQIAPQGEGDLGARLCRFFAAAFARGAGRVVVLGTDSPTLPLAFVDLAFELLQTCDAVVGPATDGGYYLLGLSSHQPALFGEIAWGTSRVLAQTVARCQETRLRVATLPPWYDVDTLDDWRALCGHLAAMRAAGIDPQLPHTEALACVSPPC